MLINIPQMSGFLNYTHNIMGGTKRLYESLEMNSNSNITRKEYNELKKRVIYLENMIKEIYRS